MSDGFTWTAAYQREKETLRARERISDRELHETRKHYKTLEDKLNRLQAFINAYEFILTDFHKDDPIFVKLTERMKVLESDKAALSWLISQAPKWL